MQVNIKAYSQPIKWRIQPMCRLYIKHEYYEKEFIRITDGDCVFNSVCQNVIYVSDIIYMTDLGIAFSSEPTLATIVEIENHVIELSKERESLATSPNRRARNLLSAGRFDPTYSPAAGVPNRIVTEINGTWYISITGISNGIVQYGIVN